MGGEDQHDVGGVEVDDDDQYDREGEVDGEDEDEQVREAPGQCRGPCRWVTGCQLPLTFAETNCKCETSGN